MGLAHHDFRGSAAFLMPITSVYRPDLIPVSTLLLKDAAQGRDLSAQEVNQALTGFITRARLITGIDPDMWSRHTFKGKCGKTQSALVYWLEEMGLTGKPVAFQSIIGRNGYFNHVWTTLALLVEGKKQWFLLDPCYQQFCEVSRRAPGQYFPLAQELANKGFITLTPDVAMTYLQAINLNRPVFESSTEAMNFMTSPPRHKDNLYYPPHYVASWEQQIHRGKHGTAAVLSH